MWIKIRLLQCQEEAKKNFEQNEEAVALLGEYTRKEERMRQLVSSGSFDSEEMKTLSAEIELLRQAAAAHVRTDLCGAADGKRHGSRYRMTGI